MFLDSFPNQYKPKETQKEIISKIESFIKSGYKNILICAPTGIGKSHIAMTVSKALNSSFILTGQKILQDQYTRDFKWAYPMKGKPNFPCLTLYDPLKMSYEDVLQNNDFSCDKGICSWKVKGSKKIEYCEFKPKLDQFDIQNKGTEDEIVIPPEGMCHYYNQKFQALHASHSIFNYASFFQTKKFSSGITELLDKNCLIADESHQIESEIIRFIGYDVRKSYLDDVKLNFVPYDLEDIDSITKLVTDVGDAYVETIRAMEENQNTDTRLSKFRNRLDKLDMIRGELLNNPENIVIQPDSIDPAKATKISIKPLNISKYVGEFFDYPHQIFLSATINKTLFSKNMGISEDECALIDVEKSPFPLENRKINFLNVKPLNRNSSISDWSLIYENITKIMQIHPNEKGLILTSSIKQCSDIQNNVSKELAKRLIPVYNEAGKKRDELLKTHEESKEPTVLLSPSLWVGVDLKDDISRFQIIVKTPFLSLSDKRTKTKMENNHTWYNYETLMKLLQGFGRSVRNEKDYALTYVLDSTAQPLITSMKKYVPKSYYDVLNW